MVEKWEEKAVYVVVSMTRLQCLSQSGQQTPSCVRS